MEKWDNWEILLICGDIHGEDSETRAYFSCCLNTDIHFRKISKHGAVAWVGTGTVWDFDNVDSQNMEWLPNFGVGYRLELQPRMNLRLDVGIGQESSGIYFNFNESF